MWAPDSIESRSATLDLSASGQSNRTVRQVICDDVVVCNASNHIDWSAQSLQFQICEDCLFVGCEPGGRVAIRRADDRILIMPDFAAMKLGEGDSIEHAPPFWMTKKGVLSFSRSSWEIFQQACVGAPAFDSIALTSTIELLQLYHFQSPRAFLGDYLSPSLANWDLILCTSGHDSEEDLMHLRKLFSYPSTSVGHDFCTPAPESYTVSAFLDTLSAEEWPIFSSEADRSVRLSDELHFRLKP